VCVCERENVCVCVCQRERESVCVCVCERERVCECEKNGGIAMVSLALDFYAS